MLAVTVQFRIKSNHTEDFRAAVLTQAANSLEKEPQCHRFDVGFDDDQPQDVFLFEVYDDEAAFAAHRETPHLAQFRSTVADWVESKELRTWSLAKLPKVT